jgi:hypothetical protein
MGFILLGEFRGQQFAQMAQQFVANAGMYLMIDTSAASGTSLFQQRLAHVPSLESMIAGGRELSELERSLVGHWVNQDFYPSGGFSMRTELHILLLPDGHCVRATRSIASSTFRDSAGNWTGFADAASALPAGDRGSWSATGTVLSLEMDDGSAYDYNYQLEGPKMITRTSRGTRFWMRSRL